MLPVHTEAIDYFAMQTSTIDDFVSAFRRQHFAMTCLCSLLLHPVSLTNHERVQVCKRCFIIMSFIVAHMIPVLLVYNLARFAFLPQRCAKSASKSCPH